MSYIILKDEYGTSYKLDENKIIACGGEGKILPLTNNIVAKIYLDEGRSLSKDKLKELDILPDNIFLKPLQILTGINCNGFSMQLLDTISYFPLDSLFSTSFVMKRNLPSNYKQIISDKIINAVKIAHDNNIIIGDLNPFNIMINDNLDVKFIDVDSYQTKSFSHNDKLLENIRDYYYNGIISKNSDYFALSIIIFNLLTGLHPYKGFHSLYGNNLKDRMIHNLSILSLDVNNIKIPKFYQPLTDIKLINMFSDIFNNNKRFLIDLNGVSINNVKFDGVIISDNLIITELYNNEIINVNTSLNYLCLTTKDKHIIFNTPNKGIVTNIGEFNSNINIILTDKYIYGFKDGILKRYDFNSKKFIEIKDIKIKSKDISIVKQYENILIILTKKDELYKIFLDESFNNSIKYNLSQIYAKSFQKHEGLYQNVGANNYIYYNSGIDLNSIKIDGVSLKDITQCKNIGIITNVVNNKIEYKLFTIDKNNKIKYGLLSERYPFTINNNHIILLKDDSLSFIDKETLNEVINFDISGNYGSYNILSTNAGIVLYNKTKLLLLNSK